MLLWAGHCSVHRLFRAEHVGEARETLAWDLADTTYGSTGARGMRRVYAQVRDEAGLWSPVFSDVIEWVAP